MTRATALAMIAVLLSSPPGGFALFAAQPAPATEPAPATAPPPTTETATAPIAKWEPVPPIDWSTLGPDDFRDDELDLPFYLHHFHTIANGVQEQGPTRGFMTLPVWRGRDKSQQAPHNARVMESHLTLAYFYCTDRPWNPYFRDARVRARLEAMLTFWCDMQHEDGRFSEYKPQGWNLPATAFGTKFMGQTLTLLIKGSPLAASRDAAAKDVGRGAAGRGAVANGAAGDVGEAPPPARIAPIDRALLQRVIDADRKAILAVLTRNDLYDHGTRYTNQYTNVFAGALAYLALFPDDREVAELLEQKFADADRDFRSPAGYFYEANGPDFGYTLYTHHSNARMAYHYARGSTIGDALEKQEAAWNEWLGYNLLREPDGSMFVFNRGIQTRQNQPSWTRQDGPFAETIEPARAFATTREEQLQWDRDTRVDLKANWGRFPDLFAPRAPGASSNSPASPYVFLHRGHATWHPTAAQRDAAVAKLPYVASSRFIKQLKDSRRNATFTYVRRPLYYAAFNSGEQITDQQRLGLGIIWSPQSGALLQSQTGSSPHAWGTRPDGAEQVLEAGPVDATFNDDLTTVTYPLQGTGRKTIVFKEDAIEIRVEYPGRFTEQVPLLKPRGAGAGLIIDVPAVADARRIEGPALYGKTEVETLTIPAIDSLTYTIEIQSPPKTP